MNPTEPPAAPTNLPPHSPASPAIRDFIAHADFQQAAIRELSGLLPADDPALDRLIGEAVACSNDLEFLFLVLAALCTGRPVQARHLAQGTMLIPDKYFLGLLASHMQGDIAAPLLEAGTQLRLPTRELLSTALFLAAQWQADHGGKVSPKLVSAARTAARNQNNGLYDLRLLWAVALLSGDQGLQALVLERHQFKPGDPRRKHLDEGARELGDQMRKLWQRNPMDLVPERASRELATGNTMRRAVAKLGRNESCPCGSGRKYKHCCLGKDEQTLHHSTSLAGVTDTEMRSHPERYLTTLDLETYPAHDAARLDPSQLPPELHEPYLANLCRARLFDACVAGLEKLGYRDQLKEAWNNILLRVAQARRKDLAERLLKLQPDAVQDRLHGGVELFLAEHDPAKLIGLLQEGALMVLGKEGTNHLPGFAHTLMNSHLCALGVMVARGVVPLLPQPQAAALLEDLLVARDKLSLPPDDPISDVLDKLSIEQHDEGEDAEALRAAQARLEAKMQEVQRYRESVARLEKELARREKLAQAPAPTPLPSAPLEEAALKDLRSKVTALKAALKERHNERNELRRELRKAQTDLEALRQTHPASAAPADAPETDPEEDLLLPQDAPEIQPVRLIEFPKAFSQTLEAFPRQVARSVMIMIGRLAAGEPAAFVGALRLKATPNVMRQRIGSDYRLLFRLGTERLQVIDLINRKDLVRRLKTLA